MPIALMVFITLATIAGILARKIEVKWATEMDKTFSPPKPKDLLPISFYGGPLDKKEEKVESREPFYVVPYPPDDDDEDVEVVGNLGDMPITMPKFAFYQQVGLDADYFFRRNLTYDEVATYMQTKTLPSDLGGSN